MQSTTKTQSTLPVNVPKSVVKAKANNFKLSGCLSPEIAIPLFMFTLGASVAHVGQMAIHPDYRPNTAISFLFGASAGAASTFTQFYTVRRVSDRTANGMEAAHRVDAAVDRGISQLSTLIDQGSEQLNTGFVRQFDSQLKLTGQMSTVLGSVEVLTAVLSDSVTQLSQMEEEVPTTVPQPSQPVTSSPTLSDGHTRMGFAQPSNTPVSSPWPGYLPAS